MFVFGEISHSSWVRGINYYCYVTSLFLFHNGISMTRNPSSHSALFCLRHFQLVRCFNWFVCEKTLSLWLSSRNAAFNFSLNDLFCWKLSFSPHNDMSAENVASFLSFWKRDIAFTFALILRLSHHVIWDDRGASSLFILIILQTIVNVYQVPGTAFNTQAS